MKDEARKSDLVDLEVTLLGETTSGMAWVVYDGSKRAVVPKSLVEVSDQSSGHVVTLSLPEWLATEKGLV